MKDRIKVLIVDDAIVVRILVGNTISKDPELEFVGKAENGKIALEKITELKPDVVILDIEMPEMSGLEVLKALKKHPSPPKVLIFSTYTTVGAQATFEALELGAADFVPKPSSSGFSDDFETVRNELLSKIKFLGSSTLSEPVQQPIQPVLSPTPSPVMSVPPAPRLSTGYELIFIEGGMGAPKTFMQFIPQIPKEISAGILIFQSMFSGFAEQFVRRLSQNANIPVKAAENGSIVQPGEGLVLVGDQYVALRRTGNDVQLAFRPKDDAEKYGAVPLLLCESIAATYGANAIGVLLSGAGEGNLSGIQTMKEHGGLIIAETPSTSLAKHVLDQFTEKHLVDHIVPTQEIVPTLIQSLGLSRLR